MRLRQIQVFLAVIDEGSIHAAARKTGLSQPAVTKSLRALEAELHTQLVRRTNHGAVATPAGRAFAAHARAAQAELRKGEEEIARLAGEGSGSVAFGVGPSAAMLIAPEAVTRFRQRFPAASTRIVEGYTNILMPMVRDGTLDFAMVMKAQATLDPAMAFRPLILDEFIVVGRKNHPLRNAGSITGLGEAVWVVSEPFRPRARPRVPCFEFSGSARGGAMRLPKCPNIGDREIRCTRLSHAALSDDSARV